MVDRRQLSTVTTNEGVRVVSQSNRIKSLDAKTLYRTRQYWFSPTIHCRKEAGGRNDETKNCCTSLASVAACTCNRGKAIVRTSKVQCDHRNCYRSERGRGAERGYYRYGARN